MMRSPQSRLKKYYHQLLQLGVTNDDNVPEKRQKRTLNIATCFGIFMTLTHTIRSFALQDYGVLWVDIGLYLSLGFTLWLNSHRKTAAAILVWSVSSLFFTSVVAFKTTNQEPVNFIYLLISMTHFTFLRDNLYHRFFHLLSLGLFLATTYYHRKYLPFSEVDFWPLAFFLLIFYGYLRFWEKEHITYQLQLREQKQLIERQKEEAIQKNLLLEESRLKEEILYKELLQAKDRELTSHTLSAVERQRILQPTVEKLIEIGKGLPKDQQRELLEVRKALQSHLDGKSWEQFLFQFEKVHPRFFTELQSRFPNLTTNDLKVCAYLKVGLGNAEIAQMIGITAPSLKNNLNRLKKKIGLGAEDNLREFMLGG